MSIKFASMKKIQETMVFKNLEICWNIMEWL